LKSFKIVIVDYEMGNIRSIENAIRHAGYENLEVSSSKEVIQSADCLILPGVGAFPDAMQSLREKALIEPLNDAVLVQKKPVLGICLGMQLLFELSEEKGITQGLGWIPGKVEYMNPGHNLRVPHIGWNSLLVKPNDSLFVFLNHDKDFYFVHSLHAKCDEKFILSEFDYGVRMVAAVKKENVVGMQFHPEKSQKNGLLAMRSFLKWAAMSTGL
jgi:glutamine amidotransferase